MIVKIKSNKRPTFRSLLKYMFNNKERLKDTTHKSFTLTHNIKGTGIENWHTQLLDNEKFRKVKRSNSVYFTHEILSWHKDDSKNLTLDKMEAMTKEYIAKRNPRGMYVATAHFDKGQYHVHILASGIAYKTGKALRMSRAELSLLKKEMQGYQISKYPELEKSVVEIEKKGKSKITDNEYQYRLRTGRETVKEYINTILKTCFKKADSVDTFYVLIKECGLEMYERSNKVTGIRYNNQKFRFSKFGFTEERMHVLELTTERIKSIPKTRIIESKKQDKNKLNDLLK